MPDEKKLPRPADRWSESQIDHESAVHKNVEGPACNTLKSNILLTMFN